jgi:oligopeptide transport system permease protein
MLRLVATRLLGGFIVLVAVATASFFLLRAAPGGPFDDERNPPPEVKRNIEERYHLNDPLPEQYARHMVGMLTLDFGQSMKRPMTVNELIVNHFPYSVTLGVMAIGIAIALGVGAGVVAAWRRNSWVDYALMTLALLGVWVPSLVLGPLFIYWFAIQAGILPAARATSFASYLLPSLVLGLIYAGTIARLARAGMIETLGQDFVRTARAKGLPDRVVVWRHALRLGILPVVTYLGPAAAALISGSFVVETIFQIPGLGYYFIDSVASRDYPVLTGLLVFYVAFLMVFNLIVDLLYGVLDPRIRDVA